jgi:IclR family acetate operon transcriptional repressor
LGADVPRGTLGTVHNAALLLDLLGQGPAYHQLTDLAERSGMSLPTLHRLLRSLMAAGLVEQDARSRYGLGPELVRLAEQYLGRLPVLKVAGPYLVDLRDSTGGTVLVATLVGGDVVYADRVDGVDAGGVLRDASRLVPALATAAGRVLLAEADDETWDRAVADIGDDGAAPPPDARERWREQGHVAVGLDPPRPRVEVAAAIRDDHRIVAALAVTASAEVFSAAAVADRVAPALVRTADAISRTLGHG